MSILGKVLSLPVRIINAPIRAAENFMNGGERVREDERLLSLPLDLLAGELESIDKEADK